MKLQLALDLFDLEGALELLEEIGDILDIVEVGTPFVIMEGLKSVREIKKGFPGTTVLADLKIMDAGDYEAALAFESGADIVTVLGVSDDATIAGAVHSARKYCRRVMADMIGVNNIKERVIEVDKLGVDFICVHTGTDSQLEGKNPLRELQAVKKLVSNAEIAVAGGITLETAPLIIKEDPDIIVVGGGITKKADKRKAALEIKEMINSRSGKIYEY